MTHSKIYSYGPLIARLLVALLFVVSGFGMLMNFGGTVGYFASMGIPMAAVALVLVLLAKIGGGLMVATGIHAREGAWALIAFTLVATVLAHTGEGQLTSALKNLAIVGGLLMIALGGPGSMSLAKKCPCPHCKKDGAMGAVCKPKGMTDMCMCGVCEECAGTTGTSIATETREDAHDEEDAEERERVV